MKAFLIFTLSFSFVLTSVGQSVNNVLINKLTVSARIDTTFKIPNIDRYDIRVIATIYNTSDDTVRYYYELCSQPFKSNNEEITVDGLPCDTDGVVTATIPPHKSTTKEVYLSTLLSEPKSKKFKVGFIYYSEGGLCGGMIMPNLSATLAAKRKEAENNPIWSNTVEIK